jgi:hypothetical protein
MNDKRLTVLLGGALSLLWLLLGPAGTVARRQVVDQWSKRVEPDGPVDPRLSDKGC